MYSFLACWRIDRDERWKCWDHFGPDYEDELKKALSAIDAYRMDRDDTIVYVNLYDTVTGEVRTIRKFDFFAEAPNLMSAEGGEEEQLTDGGYQDGPEYSPDGKKVVYTVYSIGCLTSSEYLPDVPMEIWMMNSDGTDQHRILPLFGGHGAMHINTWSKDSRYFAFTSYELREHD